MSSSAPDPTSRNEDQWTERQREVLGLLAEGRSNAEIASRLGISLDGAKWHVRESMSKLNAGSREDAADYWRRHQGLPGRLRSFRLGALVLLARPRSAVPLAVGGAALIASIVVVAVMWNMLRSDSPAAGEEPLVLASPTAAPTDTPSTAPPAGGTLGSLNGVPMEELTVSDQEAVLPDGSVLFYVRQCGTCIGGELYRLVQDDLGAWRGEALWPEIPGEVPDGYAVGDYIRAGTGRWAVAWCLIEFGLCGKRHDGSVDDVPRAILRSLDGGITWQSIGQVPAGGVPLGFQGDEVIVRYSQNDVRLLPSGMSGVAPPTGVAVQLPSGSRLTAEYRVDPIANDTSTFIGEVRPPAMQPVKYYVFPGGTLGIVQALSANLLLGGGSRNSKAVLRGPPARDLSGLNPVAAIIDIQARTISRLRDLKAELGQFVGAIYLLEGPLARVSGAGDCLNVRDNHSLAASVIGCLRDGVIVEVPGDVVEADGIRWVGVGAPGPVKGWASEEFLAIVGPAR